MRLTIKLRFKDGSEKTITLHEDVVAIAMSACDNSMGAKPAPSRTMADQFETHLQDLHTEVRTTKMEKAPPDPHLPQQPPVQRVFQDEPEAGGRH